MFEDHRFMTCFPTGLWVMRVTGYESLNERVIPCIEQLRKEQTWVPNSKVEDEGYSQHAQSFDDLHERPEFQPFNEMALSAAGSVLDFLEHEYDSCYITSCWANISRKGDGHRAHCHPNNVLSGVYYAQAPAGCGEIVFIDPRPQANVLIPDNKKQTPLNSHEFRVQPSTGMLVMFPSWLLHRVTVSKCDEARISIAFNIMLRGHLGYEKASARL